MGKILTFRLCFSLIISLLSIYLSYIVMHFALGKEGLHPLYLIKLLWSHLLWKALVTALLGLLSFYWDYLGGRCCFSYSFLCPRIYNLGNYLAAANELGELICHSQQESCLLQRQLPNMLTILCKAVDTCAWLLVIGGMASLRFWRRI